MRLIRFTDLSLGGCAVVTVGMGVVQIVTALRSPLHLLGVVLLQGAIFVWMAMAMIMRWFALRAQAREVALLELLRRATERAGAAE